MKQNNKKQSQSTTIELPTPEELFKKIKIQKLTTTQFPNEDLHIDCKDLVRKAMKFNSIQRLRCHMSTFENLVTFERIFFMYEMDLLLEILRAATPVEMEQTLEENIKMLKEVVEPMRGKWHEIVEKVDVEVAREVETKFRVASQSPEQKQSGILIP
jgi:hypothetical protein